MNHDNLLKLTIQNFLNTAFFNQFDQSTASSIDFLSARSLDLSSGPSPKNPFRASIAYGLDIRESMESNVLACDLFTQDPPFPDEYFYFVTAFDFLEHILRVLYIGNKIRFRFVELMGEVFRMLAPGGFFFLYTCVSKSCCLPRPYTCKIITDSTFPMYLCQEENSRKPPAASLYGFDKGFRMISQKMKGDHLLNLLKKP